MSHFFPRPLSLKDALNRISQILPAQRPLEVFIAQNTLRAFEHLPFEDAVERAADVYGAQAFLPEQRYLEEYHRGRITDSDLASVLAEQTHSDAVHFGFGMREILRTFLISAPTIDSFQQVKWLLREAPQLIVESPLSEEVLCRWVDHALASDFAQPLKAVNQEAGTGLEQLLRDIAHSQKYTQAAQTILWSSVLVTVAAVLGPLAKSEVQPDGDLEERMINPLLIKFCEEYLDLGFAHQLMPKREQGMLLSFLMLVERSSFTLPTWLEPLRFDIELYKSHGEDALTLIQELLNDFRVSENDCADFILREALSLKGWAGSVAFLETRPELLHGEEDSIKPKLADFIAIRLLLKKYALSSPLYRSKKRESPPPRPELITLDEIYCTAYHLLLLISQLRCGASFLEDSNAAHALTESLAVYHEVKRRRLWHLAYEHHFYAHALTALAQKTEPTIATKAVAQFLFCLDDREESIRRYVEAQSEQYETFGTAGFFGIDAYFTTVSGAQAPYCPIVIQPKHALYEVPRVGKEKVLTRYRRKQRAWYHIAGYVNHHSGSLLHELFLALAGCFSFVPMIIGVIAPRSGRIFNALFGSQEEIPSDLADITLDQQPSSQHPLPGFTAAQMAERVVRVLRGIGLTKEFADLVFVIGHGSSSRNNPFRSAYDCGACGGYPGGVNARAFCLMANRADVRALITEQSGIVIPETTHFIGAQHNTCSDQIEYYDIERSPTSLEKLKSEVVSALTIAAQQNAFERCRRFVHAHADTVDHAAQEALSRSFMLSEARPEYTHATNALCIVGPRKLTKGLFLDRRSFLVSYEYTTDSEAQILLELLRPVVAVCGGINLQYLFSAMDNQVYGAGSKLPHNIVSLLGVMNGTSSDLCTGLPSQMVEIHEPVRLMVVIHATRAQLERVIEIDSDIRRIISGGWISVTLWNPERGVLERRLTNGEYRTFTPTGEVLPQVADVGDWCRQSADNLPFAIVQHSQSSL
jgi:uncharacterized protein YbcC (UPF0753/DUF2309 family)